MTSLKTASKQGAVFVVEDDPLVRRALERLLRTAGYSVDSFDRVDTFLATVRPVDAACVVLDLHFPVGNGFEVLDWLAQGHTPLTAVVLTAHGDVPTTVRAMKGGAIELLEKPINNVSLLSAVEEGLAYSARIADEMAHKQLLQKRYNSLSPRQREVFELVAAGLANKAIAARLEITIKTVKAHRAEAMRRMRAGSLAELVRAAASMETGLREQS